MTATRVSSSLFDQVVEITYGYLGPAADRFVARQIRNHLHKAPESLGKRDLRELIDWMKLAMAFLSDDDKLVAEYITSLRRLAGEPKESTRARAQKGR